MAYSSNHFTPLNPTGQADIMQPFFSRIGPVNAGFLSQLTISFPVMETEDYQPGKANLGEDSLRVLRLFREQCTGL